MNGFSPNLVCALILWRSGLGLLMGEFPLLFSSSEHNVVLRVSCCDRPVSGIHPPQFASNDISVTTGRISTKVDRIVPLEVFYQNCSNL